MFISKKKYKEKLDLIDGYREKRDMKQKELRKAEDRIAILEYDNTNLINNNKLLIDWIYKVINDVGCYEVPEYNSIRIPVYKNEVKSSGVKQRKQFIEREIRLPEICFMKTEEK